MKKIYLFLCLFLGFIGTARAQNIQVTGKVTQSSDGKPIQGATIEVKGTINSATTDANGDFTIQCDQAATLVVSYLGMKTSEVLVSNQTTLNVSLEDDATSLRQTVVTAYGLKRSKAQLVMLRKKSLERKLQPLEATMH